MIAAADEPGSGIDDAQVAGNVLTMLLAGEDTTANTLAWMIHLLWRHPAALAACHRPRCARVCGDPARPTLEQMARLDYVEACAHETMRLKPVAPQLPLQALRDTMVGDVQVPAGTVVISLMRRDSVSDEPRAARRRLRARALAGRGRAGRRPGRIGQAHLDALRRRPAHLPGALPGAAGDEDGDGDAARPLRHRQRRHARRPERRARS